MRNLQPFVERDLSEKFVFLSGPRQVGKTHLAQAILRKLGGKYYNWDSTEDRQLILARGFLHDKLVVLDELHKYDRWKSFLKGIYDKHHEELSALVTGSARLDVYRKGGDSLLGRYFLFHLHPLTIGELARPHTIPKPERLEEGPADRAESELAEALFRWGGFPEPFYAANDEAHLRWSIQRRELLVQQDIRDFTNIQLLSLIEHLMLLLPSRVGSVLSVNNLKEDLQVAYNTVISWLRTFEQLFIVFTLTPYTAKLARSVHKERKLYLWDWSQIAESEIRFENFIAGHLWKAVQIWRDLGYGDFGLHFLRDRDRREVDFCITKDRLPWLLVEAKVADTQLSENLRYFCNRFNVKGVQIVKTPGVYKKSGQMTVISADAWLPRLP
ncbi:MAG TPA: hypothetical protein DF383_03910 [Deltaproteobacteria bacterium]|nr:hypothetical protein [Deltaproteobacteria bacterium]